MDLKTRILATSICSKKYYVHPLIYKSIFFLALRLFTEKNNWASKNAGYFADLSVSPCVLTHYPFKPEYIHHQ